MMLAWLFAAVAHAFPAIVVGTDEAEIKLQEPLIVLSREGDKQVLSFTALVGPANQELALVVPFVGTAERRQLNSQRLSRVWKNSRDLVRRGPWFIKTRTPAL